MRPYIRQPGLTPTGQTGYLDEAEKIPAHHVPSCAGCILLFPGYQLVVVSLPSSVPSFYPFFSFFIFFSIHTPAAGVTKKKAHAYRDKNPRMRVPSNWMERKPYTVVITMGIRIPLTEKQAMESTRSYTYKSEYPLNPIAIRWPLP